MARKLIVLAVLALVAVLPSLASAEVRRSTSGQRFVPGEALVRYASGVDAAERREVRSAADVAFEESLKLARTQVVSFDGSVRGAIARLEDQPGVIDAQPNYRYHAFAPDTYFNDLWGLTGVPVSVNVLPAWNRSRGSGQVIAIVDTGVDLTHPDLQANLWTGPGGVHGIDLVEDPDDNNPDDFNLHGTHVAGTAAAIADNGIGVAGVAPQAQIMAVRVLDGDGGGDTSDIADGITFAANNGAGVINLSLGGPADVGDPAMSAAISAAEGKGAVVVAAAGNGGDDGVGDNNDTTPTTPCTLPNPNLICVASVEKTGARSDFSNFGPTTVDLGAPGGDGSGIANQDILSAKPAWASKLSETFETGSDGWTAAHSGGVDWGVADVGIEGHSAADSPGPGYPGPSYANNTSSTFQATLNLAAERGCRMEALLMLDIDTPGFTDFVGVGMVSGAGENRSDFAGNTGPLSFEPVEMATPVADGRSDAKPTLTFSSDGSLTDDGAYVDNIKVLCRGNSYPNAIGSEEASSGGDYAAIAGTSMASPHVAGVVALVRAIDPGAPPSQIVQALRNGAKPASGMAGVTVTGGVVDAVGAMDASLAIPNSPPPPQPPPPPPTGPGRPSFGKFSVSRKGVITIVVKGDAGTTGVLTLTANITVARVKTVGRKTFRIGSSRKATVKVKLKKPALKQLRRKRKLTVKAKAVLKNAAGLTSSRTATIRLKRKRR